MNFIFEFSNFDKTKVIGAYDFPLVGLESQLNHSFNITYKSSVLKDVINFFKKGLTEEEAVVTLCSAKKEPYATIKFLVKVNSIQTFEMEAVEWPKEEVVALLPTKIEEVVVAEKPTKKQLKALKALKHKSSCKEYEEEEDTFSLSFTIVSQMRFE